MRLTKVDDIMKNRQDFGDVFESNLGETILHYMWWDHEFDHRYYTVELEECS